MVSVPKQQRLCPTKMSPSLCAIACAPLSCLHCMCSTTADQIDVNGFFANQPPVERNDQNQEAGLFRQNAVEYPSCLYDPDTKRFFAVAQRRTFDTIGQFFTKPTILAISGACWSRWKWTAKAYDKSDSCQCTCMPLYCQTHKEQRLGAYTACSCAHLARLFAPMQTITATQLSTPPTLHT